MKRLFLLFIVFASVLGCEKRPAAPPHLTRKDPTPTWAESERKARELLKTLTLDDKVGEMTQLAIDVLAVGEPYNLQEPFTFDTAKLQKVLVDLRVGSILNVSGHAYPRELWQHIITTIQDYAARKPSKIPVLYGIDAIHGANYTSGSVLFPQQINLAATWNPDHARRMAEITAYEVRASGIPWTFSPVLDLGRNPLWPRFWETLGEDVFLAKTLGAEIVRGYQGDNPAAADRVAACMKHFAGYSMPLSGKDRTPAWIPERQFREYFLPTFQAAVDAGALTLMINSGEVNGIPAHANPWLLKDVLRGEMGFKGLAVSDWEDVGYLVSRHRVAKDYKDAIRIAVNAGMDMAMVPMDLDFPKLLKELVGEGKVPMERIDEAVLRILTVKYELGLFDQPYYPFENYADFGSEKHVETAYQAAKESLVLLKNENALLPLPKTARLLVTGPMSNSILAINGGWSRTWQGNDLRWHETGKATILDAIRQKVGEANVTWAQGCEYDRPVNIEQAASAAKGKDAAIVCIGEMPYCELPGSIKDLRLPQPQLDLVEAIAATGTPVVLVLVEGRPRVIGSVEPMASAVLGAFLPGNEGGRAIAEVLFGDYNPSGKLPFTYPKNTNDLVPYDHKGTDLMSPDFGQNGFDPQWPFGHGLSYTSFAYENLRLSTDKMPANGEVTVSVDVRNTGPRAGMEVVQLYVTDRVASITPSVKRLRGFQKIGLEAGASITVTFTLKASDLAFVGLDNTWVTEPGEFDVQVGQLMAKLVVE